MEIKTYFFDTYALHEIILGNKNYENYKTGVAVVVTKLNLMELFYGLLIKYGEETANKYYNYFLPHAVEVTDETIKKAVVFRSLHKKMNFSYTDCVGYILSLEMKMPFLTGDQAFKNMSNIEFVK